MENKCKKPSVDVLKAIEERRRKRKLQEKRVDWYSWLLSDHPYLVLFLCLCIISGCVIVSIFFVDAPDFSEPSKGFEVRGTALSDRVVTWKNLYENTGYNQTLSTYPTLYARSHSRSRSNVQRRKTSRKNKKGNGRKKQSKNKIRTRRSLYQAYRWNFTSNGFFCRNPKSSYAKMVMEPTNKPASLWNVKSMHAICVAEKRLLSDPYYSDVCSHVDASTCCPTLSLANYVAFLSGLAACEEVHESAMNHLSTLLKECAGFYLNGTLTANCWDPKMMGYEQSNTCANVPSNCTTYNAVYSIFHYLTDADFLHDVMKSRDNQFNLQYTAVFLPALRGKNLEKLYYRNFRNLNSIRDTSVLVTGIDFGLKDSVFDSALRFDSIYPIIAMGSVMMIIALYTGSLFITIMSLISSISSLFMAYFLYTVIFEFTYFPFMNLTAAMVMVGLGADNVLVYCSAWQLYKKKDLAEGNIFIKKNSVSSYIPSSRIGVVTKVTLKHAARSMFVTGITTASAFLSNFASSVTAIRCFGMYTGLTVLMNLFLCVTWLPASVIVHEKTFSGLWLKLKAAVKYKATVCSSVKKKLRDIGRVFFNKVQVFFIVRYRWFWISLGTSLAIGGGFLIFVMPKLRLPTTSSYFQYFKSSHPFETYTLQHKKKFAFEKGRVGYMPVTIVFGIIPIDNGDPLDPDISGSLLFNPHFNMSDPRSQTWLLGFCQRIQNQTFYRDSSEDFDILRMCFVKALKKWMSANECRSNGIERFPCCKASKFPYSPPVFLKCLKRAVLQLTHTPGVRLDKLTPGPRFDRNDTLKAVIVEFPSTQPYTGSYSEIAQFYNTVEAWLEQELQTAPPGLREDAWFISDLEFHALQHGLYRGTVTAIGLSIFVVCAALIITTCNITITLLANVTIGFTIFVIVGILVLMGWELNILESVTISIAIGLSVDFTVHYAVAYLLVPASDRQSRVELSVSTMGSAIALAALTSFLAGLCMLPAQVIAYYRFGIFLMLVMTVSWFYSTYFFQALCTVFGPKGKCGHLFLCCTKKCKTKKKTQSIANRNVSSESSARKNSDKKLITSESPSVTVIEMSSCGSV